MIGNVNNISQPAAAMPQVSVPQNNYTIFGKEAWENHFGQIGEVPPVPQNINEILNSTCPYHLGKKVEETHFLFLVPTSINGRPLTLNLLAEFAGQESHVVNGKIQFFQESVAKEIGEKEESYSYWALITRDILPDSLELSMDEQERLLKENYEVPTTLEAVLACCLCQIIPATSFLSEHSPDDENCPIYTRCSETIDVVDSHYEVNIRTIPDSEEESDEDETYESYVAVGGCTDNGFQIDLSLGVIEPYDGLAAVRRFVTVSPDGN